MSQFKMTRGLAEAKMDLAGWVGAGLTGSDKPAENPSREALDWVQQWLDGENATIFCSLGEDEWPEMTPSEKDQLRCRACQVGAGGRFWMSRGNLVVVALARASTAMATGTRWCTQVLMSTIRTLA